MSEKQDDRMARLNDGYYSLQAVLCQCSSATRDDIMAGLKIAMSSAEYVADSVLEKSVESITAYRKFTDKAKSLYTAVLFKKYNVKDSRFGKKLKDVYESFGEFIYFICDDIMKENGG